MPTQIPVSAWRTLRFASECSEVEAAGCRGGCWVSYELPWQV